jgi:FixJ family two-component response regulator
VRSGDAVLLRTGYGRVRAQLKSAMDGLNAAAAKAKDAKVRDAMSALAEDYRQILDAVAAGQPAPTGLG